MIENQVHDHPPLQVCFPKHQPRMWRADGNGATRFYVECKACGVRTPRMWTPEAAAHAWAVRDVAPIMPTVAVA